MKLPGWSCAASYFFITSHAAEYSMAMSNQDSIGAAGGASSLIRNAGVKEVWRHNTIRDMLSDVQVMLSQMICAAYVHKASLGLEGMSDWEWGKKKEK
eukprot:1148631-Pelagomonas_calceolata.AAC.3